MTDQTPADLAEVEAWMKRKNLTNIFSRCGYLAGVKAERERNNARIRALEAACEPFARCRWPLDLGSRCGECSGCRLAALLARKETP